MQNRTKSNDNKDKLINSCKLYKYLIIVNKIKIKYLILNNKMDKNNLGKIILKIFKTYYLKII